jgi:tetratricopeptide (TPR) repeat protein
MLQGDAIARTTADAYNNRGFAKQTKGDLEGAIADYSRALELNPRYATAYHNRGIAKRARGDLDGSIADYSRALELNRSRR